MATSGSASFCPEHKWQPQAMTEVHNKLEVSCLELFVATKRHDIKRDERNQRGYQGVKFNPG